MPAEPSTPDPRVIKAYLDDTEGDLEAARRLLVEPLNRFAAFHLQQAAEKLIKAVRLHRGMNATADHNLYALVEALPSDEWRSKLEPLRPLTAFATSYRYPSPVGNLKSAPPAAELQNWIQVIAALTTEARAALLPSGS